MASNTRHRMIDRQQYQVDAQSYDQFVKTLNPFLWYKFNETSGTTVKNYGSGGSTYDGTFTPGIGAVNQIGQFGLSSAYMFDGLDSRVAITNNAAYANTTKQSVIVLFNPTNAGEGNSGAAYFFGNGNNKALYSGSATLYHSRRVTNATNAQVITNTGQVPISNVWQFLIMKYNDVTDRKVHLYKGFKGQLTEYTYGTNTTATGTLNSETGALQIGNSLAANASFSGLFGNFIWINDDVPLSKLIRLIKLAKV